MACALGRARPWTGPRDPGLDTFLLITRLAGAVHPYVNQSKIYVKCVLRITDSYFTYHVLRIATYSRIDMGTYFYVSRIYVLRIATYLHIPYRIRHMKGIVLRKTHFVAQGTVPWDVPWELPTVGFPPGLGETGGDPSAPLGTPWARFGLPWAPLGRSWAHLGHPLGTLGVLGHALDTLGAPLGHLLGSLKGTAGRPLGSLGHPFSILWRHLGGHFCHLTNVSPKRPKQSLFWDTCLTSFREGCACNPTMPVQSERTFGHYF